MAGPSTGGRTAAGFEDEVEIRTRRTEPEDVVILERGLPSGGPRPPGPPASPSTSPNHLSTGCGTGIAPLLPTLAQAHAEGADRRLSHGRFEGPLHVERSSDVVAPAEGNAEFGIELRASDMTSAVPPEPSVPEVVADAGRRRPDVLLRGDLRDR